MNDNGTLSVKTGNLPVPPNTYVATHAWVQAYDDAVGLFFGQLSPDGKRLVSRLEVRYALEAFYAHLWKNSRNFHEELRKIVSKGPRLSVARRNLETALASEPEQKGLLSATLEYMVVTDGDASIDFFHLAPATMHRMNQEGDPSRFEVEPKVRVELTAIRLLDLLDALPPIAEQLSEHFKDSP